MEHGLGTTDHGHYAHHHIDHGPGGEATSQALFVMLGSHADHHFAFDYTGSSYFDAGHSDHFSVGAVDRQGDTTAILSGEVPIINRDGEVIRGYGIHVTRHGQVAIMTRFGEVARSLDLINLDLRPNMERYSRTYHQILSLDAWGHGEELEGGIKRDIERLGPWPNPLGWYLGATGHTELFRQKWQIGKRSNMFSKPCYDSKACTFIELSLVQWRFHETCDYETRMELRIISQLEHDARQGTWTYRRTPFEAHQKAAIRIYREIMRLLSDTKPNQVAVAMRALIDPPKQSTEISTQTNAVQNSLTTDQVAATATNQTSETVENNSNERADLTVELDY